MNCKAGCENLCVFIIIILSVGCGKRSTEPDSLKALKKPSQSVKPDTKQVRLIPPGKAAARDEGPRLIPLHEKAKDHLLAVTAEYYIALADKLLHRRSRH